jgi:hypothetical protein
LNAHSGRIGIQSGLVEGWVKEWMGPAASLRAPAEKVIVTIGDIRRVECLVNL